ncbi:MAG: polysaccharide deacetylase family protein [Acidobacteria bacterium]|nr:polysaccharide deacetylase family protein [Acidobacteriota bacterium]
MTVPLPWVITVLMVLAVVLVTALGTIFIELESGRHAVPPPIVLRPTPLPALRGHLERFGHSWKAVVTGQPGLTVLVSSSSRPLAMVTLDAHGKATTPTLRLRGRYPSVTLTRVGEGVTAVPATPTPTATPSPTPTSAPTPTPTSTPPPTPTKTPVPSPTPTPVPSPTPTPIPAPTSTPTPVPSPTPAPPPPPRPTGAPASRPAPAPEQPGTWIAWPTPGPVHRQARQPAYAPPDLSLVRDAGPRIALTFDGGSTADGTARLLDLLRRLHLRVTLFLTGAFIRNNPPLVRQAVLDGFEIGNHTFSHPHLTTYAQNRRQRLRAGITRRWFVHQLTATENLFFRTTGHHMAPLWRAPFGEENRILRGWAFEAGYLHVRWSSLKGASLDSHDWVEDEHSSLYENPNTMLARLLRFPRLDGGIVLMHLATRRHVPPWSVLPTFLQALRGRGLQPGTVGELLRASPRWRPLLEKVEANHRARLAASRTAWAAGAQSDRGGVNPRRRRAAARPHSTRRSN